MKSCALKSRQRLSCNLAATEKREDFRDVNLNNVFVYYEMADLWDWVRGRWDKFCFSEDMLSRAENRLCMQALLTRGRGEDEAVGTSLAVLHKSCCSNGAGRCPYGCWRRAGGTNPSPRERWWPCSHQPQWRLWGRLALASPCPSATYPEGQPYSKPSARAGCHQTCRRRCRGMREIKDHPLPSPSHPTAGSREHPQLLVSDEESGLALFVRNWAWDQLSCSIRCVWQPWPLQLCLLCCQ